MAKNSRPEFDPRFDPAFQRGYTPKPGETMRVRPRAVEQPADDDQPANVETPPSRSSRVPPPGAQGGTVPGSGPRTAPRPAQGTVPPVAPHRTHEPDPLGIERAHLAQLAEAELAEFELDGEYSVEPDAGQEAVPEGPWNPYIILLLIIGIVLSVVGFIVLISAVYALVTSSPIDAFDRTMDELGIYTAPPLMTIGLGTLVALLFLPAIRRLNRR